MPTYDTAQLVFLPVGAIVIIVGLFGNACTLIAITKFKHLRSPVNILLANIAASDLMCLLISMPDMIEYYSGTWVLGDAVCRIHGALLEVSYTVCVFSLTAVAFERYWAMCRPFGIIHSKQKVKHVVGLIWLIGNLLSAPLYYGWGTKTVEGEGTICGSIGWTSDQGYIIYYAVQTIAIYVIPLVLIIITHLRIYFYLRKKSCHLPPPKPSPQSTIVKPKCLEFARHSTAEAMTLERIKNSQKQRNRSVIRILVVVTATFFLLWTPFIFLRLLRIYVPVPILLWRTSQFLILVMCSINFFVYSYMSSDFRKVFQKFVARSKKDGDGEEDRVRNSMRLSQLGNVNYRANTR